MMMIRKWVLLGSLLLVGLLAACAGSGASQPLAAAQDPGSQATATQAPAATATQPPAAGGIKGTVKDAATGKALAGALIYAKSQDGAIRVDAMSGADGSYQIDLPKGSYRLTANQAGYQTSSSATPIDTSGADYTIVPINLIPSGESKATATTAPKAAGSANCAGVEYKGFCWYYGDAGLSCEAVCSAHGGYSEGTQTFAGSGGSPEKCAGLLAKLEINVVQGDENIGDPFAQVVWSRSTGGSGCYTLPRVFYEGTWPQTYWDTDPTTAQAVIDKPDFHRVCACQK
jgi:hypothetical protein